LEHRVSDLKSNDRPQQLAPPVPIAPRASAAPANKSGTDESSDAAEELSLEQLRQRVDRRYALLEKRFADEPADPSANTPEERTVRQRVQGLEGYELSKIECRSTMCRLEVKAAGASAAAILSQLGLTEGGETRRREDGTLLIFAGREGFPFQEVNRVD